MAAGGDVTAVPLGLGPQADASGAEEDDREQRDQSPDDGGRDASAAPPRGGCGLRP
jgi:hypothetical protein